MKNPYIISGCICVIGVITSFLNPELGFVIGSGGVSFILLNAIWNSLK
jgi:hypothetical protein